MGRGDKPSSNLNQVQIPKPCKVVVSHGQTLFCIEGKGVDMAIEQLVAPHRGVHTNHSTVFSHMIPEVCD